MKSNKPWTHLTCLVRIGRQNALPHSNLKLRNVNDISNDRSYCTLAQLFWCTRLPSSLFVFLQPLLFFDTKIKSLLYSRHYTEVCIEWRSPSPRLSAWTTQLRTSVETVGHCVQFDQPGNQNAEPFSPTAMSVTTMGQLSSFLNLKKSPK